MDYSLLVGIYDCDSNTEQETETVAGNESQEDNGGKCLQHQLPSNLLL